MTTLFVRLIEAEDKGEALRVALEDWKGQGNAPVVYAADARAFSKVPGSPFAYWVDTEILSLFEKLPPLETDEKAARRGLATHDDFRFLRLAWEPRTAVSHPYMKGGDFSRFFADNYMRVMWRQGGRELAAPRNTDRSYDTAIVAGRNLYFRPGLTWSRRSQKGLSLRCMPRGAILGDKGPAILVTDDDPQRLLALLALCNSTAFAQLVRLHMAFGSFEVGVINRTPVPKGFATAELIALGRDGWRERRKLEAPVQTSHAFTLPEILQGVGASIIDRVHSWISARARMHGSLQAVIDRVDAEVLSLYSIPGGMPAFAFAEEAGPDYPGLLDEDAESVEHIDANLLAGPLMEWVVGVVFGRFDIRLATGERPVPHDPDPFDPLPVCSPGMLQDENGHPAKTSPAGYPIEVAWDGILVDDEGHPRDIVRQMREVMSEVSHGRDWAAESEEILGRDLRSWVRRSLFDDHIRRYSRSRRKAPIFWRLGTPSGSYSVWLYYPRATGDTLYRVLNDYVDPKLRHEESALLRLQQEGGNSPTAGQQRAIESQETFVSEIQDMRGELEILTQLWKPAFDDGVVLNFAPFWRLVAHTRTWQRECQKHWEKLQRGEYDWSYTAMRLWPERVVPACAADRSFAIAHGLEEEFFAEGDDASGTTQVHDNARIQDLVDERTSAAVKQALEALLSR